jgi:hypothetical protein
VISNVRMAMIWGSGLPYQMASVPQSTRCAPTRLRSLPRAWAAWSGVVSNWRQRVAMSTQTLSSGGTPWTSSDRSNVSMPMVAFGSYGPSVCEGSQAA